jgi:hypothetical protein
MVASHNKIEMINWFMNMLTKESCKWHGIILAVDNMAYGDVNDWLQPNNSEGNEGHYFVIKSHLTDMLSKCRTL